MSAELLVRAWLLASKGDLPTSPDAFFRFVAAWVAFNATYVYHYGPNVGDKGGAIRFASDPDNQKRHQQCMQSPEYRKAVEAFAEKGVINLRNGQQLQITNVSDFKQVMSVVYQIRCNLFHGGKLPSDVRDLRLVEAAHAILDPHLDGFWT